MVACLARISGLVLFLGFTSAHADDFDRVRARIQQVMTYNHVPSVAVAVARNGKIEWEEGFGFANIAQRIPATAHTSYSVASISKPVTATALMILAERGELDLTKPIDAYLGRQKLRVHEGKARDVTVRRVAAHTAGLPVHANFFYEDEPAQRPSMEETIRRYGIVVAPPGESFTYSNLGYGLLESAIETVSGKSYAAFVHDELLEPLGLHESSASPTPRQREQAAVRYWNGNPLPFYDFDHRAGSALFMSAHDLVRFGMFHLHGGAAGREKPLLSAAGLQSMRDLASLSNGMNTWYGFGWFVGARHGLKWFGHDGGMAGVATSLSIYPEADLVVVVLTNGAAVAGSAGGLDLVQQIEDAIVHALLPATIRTDHEFKAPAELLGNWSGAIQTYSGRVPVELSFRTDGSVFARLGTAAPQEVVDLKLDPQTSIISITGLRGDMGTSDAARHSHAIQLKVKLRTPDRLSGAATANSIESLSDRLGNALSHWVELRRTAD
jgi:CubicO group peptidase (beta-lactamase class C family)